MYAAIEAEHCSHEYTQSIDAPPDAVFPLLCPMREQEWIPGWRARMIHSRSGVAEDGALFATPGPQGETLWLVTGYEPPRRVQFVRYQPEGVVVRIVAGEPGSARALPVGQLCQRRFPVPQPPFAHPGAQFDAIDAQPPAP